MSRTDWQALVGQRITAVEADTDGTGEDGFIVLELDGGGALYADAPAFYSRAADGPAQAGWPLPAADEAPKVTSIPGPATASASGRRTDGGRDAQEA